MHAVHAPCRQGLRPILRARAVQTGPQAHSTRRVYGVLRHVLANGSASFQSHPNHANTVRPNPADRAIPHTKDLRAETGSFGAFKPNTFTCARFFFLSRARERVWKGISHSRLMASARMIGREGLSRFTSWISGCQKRAFTLWYSSGVGPARCTCVAHEIPVLILNCGLCVFMCASRQTVPNHVFCRGLNTILVPNHVHVPRRADMA